MPNNPQTIVYFHDTRHEDPGNLLDYLIARLSAEKERMSVRGTLTGIELLDAGHPTDESAHAKPAHVPLPIGYATIKTGAEDIVVPIRAMNPLEAMQLRVDLTGRFVTYDARTTRFERNEQTLRELLFTRGTLSFGAGRGRVETDVSAWYWK